MIYLNVYRLHNDVELPTYGTTLSNCFDLSFQPTNKLLKGMMHSTRLLSMK
jgi:hypothetical protein